MTQYAQARIAPPMTLGALSGVTLQLLAAGAPEEADVEVLEEPPIPGVVVRASW